MSLRLGCKYIVFLTRLLDLDATVSLICIQLRLDSQLEWVELGLPERRREEG